MGEQLDNAAWQRQLQPSEVIVGLALVASAGLGLPGIPRMPGMGKRQARGVPAPILPGHVRLGRNQPCPCGSGRKFKRCCGSQA